MKVILVGASGTVGKNVLQALEENHHEIIKVGRKSGDFQVNIEDPQSLVHLFRSVGKFDAVVNASGDIAFAPLAEITQDQWSQSFKSKLMGQINLVQQALPYINDGGSFTLISGIIGDEQILAGTVAATVNKALEGFVKAAACELPRNLRINLVSPTVLKDSEKIYGSYFPGFKSVDGKTVGQAFKKSVMGIQTGQIYRAL